MQQIRRFWEYLLVWGQVLAAECVLLITPKGPLAAK